MFTLPIIVAFLLGMVVLTVAIITLGEVFESKERTKRVKAEIAAQQEKDYRNRMEFASHNEKKEIVKQALAEHDRMKISNSIGISSSPSSSSPVEMMQEAQRDLDSAKTLREDTLSQMSKSANPNQFSSHKPSCPSHPMNRERVLGRTVPAEHVGMDLGKADDIQFVEISGEELFKLITGQNESSPKNTRTNVRKTATKKTSRKPQAKKARSRKTR